MTATATVTFAEKPISAGLMVTTPDSLERGGSGTVTVTANDVNGNPVARGHMINIDRQGRFNVGFRAAILHPDAPRPAGLQPAG